MQKSSLKLLEIFQKRKEEILDKWVYQQTSFAGNGGTTDNELRRECSEFLDLFSKAIEEGAAADLNAPKMQPIVQLLQGVSRDRAVKGFSPTETAGFIFTLKEILLPMVQSIVKSEEDFAREVVPFYSALDQLGLVTFEHYLSGREEVIARQALDMADLSTPVVKVWDGILTLPLIGTLDSKRTMVVMEKLLQKIVESGSTVAILDITGVPTVDTLVANHIMKTVAATRLLGAECIITGISPSIAQTIVHLGVDLSGILTRATMAEGLKLALKLTHQSLEEDRQNGSPSEQASKTQPIKGKKEWN